jgi:hypothetical protein
MVNLHRLMGLVLRVAERKCKRRNNLKDFSWLTTMAL